MDLQINCVQATKAAPTAILAHVHSFKNSFREASNSSQDLFKINITPGSCSCAFDQSARSSSADGVVQLQLLRVKWVQFQLLCQRGKEVLRKFRDKWKSNCWGSSCDIITIERGDTPHWLNIWEKWTKILSDITAHVSLWCLIISSSLWWVPVVVLKAHFTDVCRKTHGVRCYFFFLLSDLSKRTGMCLEQPRCHSNAPPRCDWLPWPGPPPLLAGSSVEMTPWESCALQTEALRANLDRRASGRHDKHTEGLSWTNKNEKESRF